MDKHRISHSFAAAAEDYDAHALVQRHAAQQLAQRIKQRWPQLQSICEIGCGTGNLTEHLARAFPQADMLATDLAPAMLTACQRRIGTRARYAQADGEHLDVQGVDLIASSLTFQWFSDPLSALERLAKQAPRLAVATLIDGTFAEWKQAHARLGLDDGGLPLLTESDLEALRRPWGAACDVDIETVQEFHPNAIDFVRSIKAIGAGTPRKGHAPAPLGKVLRQFPEGITVSYRVAYLLVESAVA